MVLGGSGVVLGWFWLVLGGGLVLCASVWLDSEDGPWVGVVLRGSMRFCGGTGVLLGSLWNGSGVVRD